MPPVKHLVFIVDDDADDRDSIKDAFLHNRHEPEFVFLHSADQLVKQLHTSEVVYPSLILLDLNMPGKNGRDVLYEIKSDNKLRQIPVIILTTSSSQKDRQAAYAYGANCFITKPDTFNRLVQLTDAIAKLWLNAP